MQDPVRIYNPTLPGEELIDGKPPWVEREAYRTVWYALGWRSDDDPEYAGEDLTPPFGGPTFLESPLVPNPASLNPQAAASIGEVQQLVAESSAGFLRSMNPKSPLTAFVSNTTTETSALTAVFAMPRISHEAVFKMTAHGICRCTAGGPVTMTFRLKNTTDGTTIAQAAVSLVTDANGNRPWHFEVDGEGNVVLADSVCSVGRLMSTIPAGTPVDDIGQAAIGFGTDPQNWDLTCQFSVANAGITASIYGAKVFYALPGA